LNANVAVKAVVPGALRRKLRAAAGIDDLHARIDELEERLSESREDTWQRSRSRWREAAPTANLTWDEELTGDAFIGKVRDHGGFGQAADVLEIGPGYGRLHSACRDLQAPFRTYLGVDLSETNVAHLNETFGDDAVSFVQGDIETIQLDREVDLVISSLTLKHIYPSWEKALANVAASMRSGGLFAIDLIEGDRRYWEHDNETYIRWYTRDEIRAMFGRIGVTDVEFDEVEHCPGRTRLLVLARKP
jgi:SAM-dependent methyltransferase